MPLEKVRMGDVVKCLADLYNDNKVYLNLSEKVKILEALGYGDDHKLIGELLAGKASLNDEGIIVRGRYRSIGEHIGETSDE